MVEVSVAIRRERRDSRFLVDRGLRGLDIEREAIGDDDHPIIGADRARKTAQILDRAKPHTQAFRAMLADDRFGAEPADHAHHHVAIQRASTIDLMRQHASPDEGAERRLARGSSRLFGQRCQQGDTQEIGPQSAFDILDA